MAPLLAGVIAEGLGLRMLFGLSLAVSAGALFWLWVLVRDPRVRKTGLAKADRAGTGA
jgi:hypothetical protein